jgi:putative oxidoreductase
MRQDLTQPRVPDPVGGKTHDMRFGIALLRAVVGALFIGHGLQKLAGWFGGHGLEATAQGFESMGLRPGKVHATAAGAAETAGGALLLTGAATPLAAGMLTGTMTVAIHKVHGPKGVWNTQGGFEYNVVLMAALFAITAAGPGTLAVDEGHAGTAWAFAEFAAGLLGAEALLRLTAGQDEPPPEAPGPPPGNSAAREPAVSGSTSG